MRLRLFIQRNRLPSTKIWWDTSSFEPGDDHNVSTLLSRVGQIVPMESGGWGLEDYAVEVDGFEVLHFQEVERIIREGDEVVIRPLTTTEIRQRRASGRRQISASGRKLLDGTPFGRPMITTRPAPDRPRLSIPLRKRVKTGSGVDHSTLVQVGSDHEDYSGDEGESDDESYKESDEEQEVSEVGDDDEEVAGADMEAEIEACAESDEAEESGEEGEGIDEADFQELSRDYENPLMDYFDNSEVASSQVSFSEQPSQLRAICGARDTQSLQGQNGSLEGDSFEDDYDYTDSESSRDQDSGLSDEGDSSNKIIDGNEESMEVDIVGQAGDFFLPDRFYSDASAAGGAADSPKLPQPYQSEDMSEEVGEDERECEPEHLESSVPAGPELDEDSRSSSEDSFSSSDSEESDGSEQVGVPKDNASSGKASQNGALSTPQGPPPSQVVSVPIEQPRKLPVAPENLPYRGSPGTKARNVRKRQRRNNERLLTELVNTGVLPKGSTVDDLKKHQEKRHLKNAGELLRPRNEHPLIGDDEKQTSLELSEERAAEEPPRDVADHVLQKTQQGQQPNDLLVEGANKKGKRKRLKKIFAKAKKKESVPADWDFNRWLTEREKKAGVEEQPNSIHVEEDADGDVSMESIGKPVEQSSKIPLKQTEISLLHDRPPSPPPHQDPPISAEERGRPRGPRKIVYDDDGVPNPVYAGFDEQQHEVEDPEAWRNKIVLSAVECEQEGVEIPTPGFPFKQPTYQSGFGWEATGNNKRKRNGGTKKKRKQRQQDKENYSYDYGYRSHQDPGYGDWDGHDYYDDSTVAPTSAKGKDTDVAGADLVDDLPLLPENIASLYPLTKPVLPGTIVAFKQLMLTEDYTPIMADYRTAIVQAVHAQEKDGPALELRLAVRDRPKRRIDPETGEKILRKFEMPGDENEDEGFLDLMFGQLLEAKVVRLPESAGLDQSVNGDEGGGIGEGDTQEDNPDDQRDDGNTTHGVPMEADSYPHNLQANATLSDGLAPPSAEGSQDQEQNLELGLGPETQAAQPQESLKSPSPVDGILGTAVNLSSVPTSQAEASIPATSSNGESDPSYEPDSVSDSDGLESLESMFASSQRIKPEPSSQRPLVLPPLPVFSPLGAGVEGDDERSQRQIQEEATNEKRTTLKATRRTKASNGAKITNSEVQIIDLTETSDPVVIDDDPRGVEGGGGSRVKGKQWRAVKG